MMQDPFLSSLLSTVPGTSLVTNLCILTHCPCGAAYWIAEQMHNLRGDTLENVEPWRAHLQPHLRRNLTHTSCENLFSFQDMSTFLRAMFVCLLNIPVI